MSRKDLFLGKVLGFLPFPLIVGWASQLMAIALATLSGSFVYAEPSDWIFPLLLTPFLSMFFCALSALISTRCDTVRSAAQLTGLSLLILFPAISISSQAFAGNAEYQCGVLIALLIGAAICFPLAAQKLKS